LVFPDEHSADMPESVLPWFARLQGGFLYERRSCDYPTRREAEDAAAQAFAKLTPQQQAEYLQQ
jgi:hypothetical protein